MYSIGKKIKELRKEQNMTQAQLAEKLGLTYQAVSKWENGTSSPDISMIPDITRAFSVSADALFDLVKPEANKDEIYADYRDILDNTNNLSKARSLLEKAVKAFPFEYKFYIMLGNTVCECIGNAGWTSKNTDIQYAMKCFNKVIDECTDDKTIDLAKYGKYVILCNTDDNILKRYSVKELDRIIGCLPDYMRLVDPNWEKH